MFRYIKSVYSPALACVVLLTVLGCSQGSDQSQAEDDATQDDNPELTYAEPDASPADWPDSRLESAFTDYWRTRFAGQADEVWPREAPHFRFISSRDKYDIYIKQNPAKLLTIQIRNISLEKEYRVDIQTRLLFERNGETRQVDILDRWVLVDEDWYHLIQDRLVFPETYS